MATLGDLELIVLRAVGNLGESLPGDIHREVSRVRRLAYTTVTNTLYRLVDKGLVRTRLKSRKRVFYRLAADNPRYQSVLRRLVVRLQDAFGEAAISQILQSTDLERPRKRERRHG